MWSMYRDRDAKQPPPDFGPWTDGLVNVVESHAVPLSGLLAARDVDIDRDGRCTSRTLFDLVDNSSGYDYPHEHNGVMYAVATATSTLGQLTENSFTAIRMVNGPISWSVLDGTPIYADYDGVYEVDGTTATQLDTGYTTTDEERFTLAPMPGGKFLQAWQGRLLLTRGRKLLWSEALRYGVYSPARDFWLFPQPPQWVAGLPTGVFVGLPDSVVFLSGSDPTGWTARSVGGRTAPGAAIVTDSHQFGGELASRGQLAVWFSDVGFVVGMGDGSVLYPQAGRLKDLPLVPSRIVQQGDRLYMFETKE